MGYHRLHCSVPDQYDWSCAGESGAALCHAGADEHPACRLSCATEHLLLASLSQTELKETGQVFPHQRNWLWHCMTNQ
jgi:hypothetical protein